MSSVSASHCLGTQRSQVESGGGESPAGWRRAALVVAVMGAALLALALPRNAAAATITSSGPLTEITISPDLNCDVRHSGDTAPEFYGATACGTLVAVGGTLYGPASIPAGNSASPRTAFTPVSQTGPTGSGTSASPYTIVTVVDLGSTGLRLTETDSYVVGEESYRTDVLITNTSATAQSLIVYRAGDCFLQNSDAGFGRVDGSAVACVAAVTDANGNLVPGTRIEQWYPLTAGSNYMEDFFDTVWAAIGSQQPFPNTCRCSSSSSDYIDNGAGLSWNLTIAAGASATVSHLTVFSPLGRVPLTTSKTADQASATASSTDGYTITVTNPNTTSVTLDSITDTLPAGFTYVAGSTTGATTANPTVSGQTLTWTGPFNVMPSATITLHFSVTVSSTPGDYFNEAGATATGFTVVPTGATAKITVTAAAASADLSVTKTDSPDPVVAGSHLTYTLVVHNGGPDAAAGVSVSDTLPAGVTFVSASAGCSGTSTVTCSLGTLASGADATVTIVVTPTAAGQLTNTATVSASTADPVAGNNSSTTTTTVTAPSNQPPVCSNVVASPSVLWPPNHGFVLVTLSGATDPDGDSLTITVTGVTQDEPRGGNAPDAKAGPASNSVFLRAERLGSGDGRVYRVSFTVSDGHGSTCSGSVLVSVPHDQSGAAAVDSGQTVDSFATD